MLQNTISIHAIVGWLELKFPSCHTQKHVTRRLLHSLNCQKKFNLTLFPLESSMYKLHHYM